MLIRGSAAGDAYNLIVSIQTYPSRLFDLALVVGVFFIRRRRAKAGILRPEYVAWKVALLFSILVNLFVLVRLSSHGESGVLMATIDNALGPPGQRRRAFLLSVLGALGLRHRGAHFLFPLLVRMDPHTPTDLWVQDLRRNHQARQWRTFQTIH